jgi:hypothetical protein
VAGNAHELLLPVAEIQGRCPTGSDGRRSIVHSGERKHAGWAVCFPDEFLAACRDLTAGDIDDWIGLGKT